MQMVMAKPRLKPGLMRIVIILFVLSLFILAWICTGEMGCGASTSPPKASNDAPLHEAASIVPAPVAPTISKATSPTKASTKIGENVALLGSPPSDAIGSKGVTHVTPFTVSDRVMPSSPPLSSPAAATTTTTTTTVTAKAASSSKNAPISGGDDEESETSISSKHTVDTKTLEETVTAATTTTTSVPPSSTNNVVGLGSLEASSIDSPKTTTRILVNDTVPPPTQTTITVTPPETGTGAGESGHKSSNPSVSSNDGSLTAATISGDAKSSIAAPTGLASGIGGTRQTFRSTAPPDKSKKKVVEDVVDTKSFSVDDMFDEDATAGAILNATLELASPSPIKAARLISSSTRTTNTVGVGGHTHSFSAGGNAPKTMAGSASPGAGGMHSTSASTGAIDNNTLNLTLDLPKAQIPHATATSAPTAALIDQQQSSARTSITTTSINGPISARLKPAPSSTSATPTTIIAHTPTATTTTTHSSGHAVASARPTSSSNGLSKSATVSGSQTNIPSIHINGSPNNHSIVAVPTLAKVDEKEPIKPPKPSMPRIQQVDILSNCPLMLTFTLTCCISMYGRVLITVHFDVPMG
jgi:hypothetical protein